MAQDSNVVIDHGKSQWSDLWKKEDFLAIWLGFIIIAVCILAYTTFGPKDEFAAKINAANEIQAAEAAKAPFKTIAWYKAQDDKGKLKGTSTPFGKFASHWTKTPGSWTSNPLESLMQSEEQAKALNEKAMPKYEEAKAKAEAALTAAVSAEEAAAGAMFQDKALNDDASAKIKAWRDANKAAGDAKKKTEHKAFNLIPGLIGLCVFLALAFGVGIAMMGKSLMEARPSPSSTVSAPKPGAWSWACSSPTPLAPPSGSCRPARSSSSSRPASCSWAPRSSSTRSWPSASPASSWPGS